MTRIEALRSAINTLTDRHNELRSGLQEYADRDGEPSVEERTQFEADVAEFATVGPEIEARQAELRQLEAIADAPERAREAASPTLIVAGQKNVSMREGVEFGTPEQVRSAALRAVDEIVEVSDETRSAIHDKLVRLDTVDGKLSRHVIAHSRVEYRSAFSKLMTASLRGTLPNLTEAEHRAMEHARAVTITSGSAGTAIPTPLDPTLIVTGAHAGFDNPWRSVARNVQTMSNTWNGVSTAGITVAYGAEAEEAADNAPTTTAIACTLHRGRGLVPFSIEAEQDWAGLQSEITSLFQIAKDDNDEAVFSAIAAPGADTPGGFPHLLTMNWSGQIKASAGANAFAVADVHALYNFLPARFRSRATWIAAAQIFGEIRQFNVSGGSPIMTELTNGMPATILGRPHVEAPSVDSTYGSGENYVLFLAAPEAFIIADRLGTTVELIPHLFGATNNFPTGQRGLFMNWRTGTQIGNQSAAVTLNVT